MVTIYENMGLEPQVSKEIVDILSTNKTGFLSVMMIEELQLIPDEENPFKNSIVTFFSFCIFGLMPLIPFLIAAANDFSLDSKYIIATISISFFFLFVLGFGKSFVTSATWYYSSAETILIGAVSAGAAFGIGSLFGGEG
jgi:VIT1/CCC1 family predicted Fe2+/Mn2+ transporter